MTPAILSPWGLPPGTPPPTRWSIFGAQAAKWGVVVGVLVFLVAAAGSVSGAPDPLNTWHIRTNTFEFSRCLAVGNGVVVAGTSSKRILSSRDGQIWASHDLSTNRLPQRSSWGVAYGNGRFVAAGPGSGFAVSTDGETWTDVETPRSWDAYDLLFAQGLFVAVGGTSGPGGPQTGAAIWTSPDGLTWTMAPGFPRPGFLFRSVASGNGRFLAVSPGNLLMTSSNGLGWSEQSVAPSDIPYDVSFGNGLFLGLGSASAASSTDGLHWVRGGAYGSSNFELTGVTFSGGLFFVGAPGRFLATSTDGAVWVPRLLPDGDATFAVASSIEFNSRIVVGGSSLLQSDPIRPAAPLILVQPSDRLLRLGGSYLNSVEAESPLPVRYQWRRDGQDLPGATNATVRIEDVPFGLAGVHQVVVRSDGGSITSAPALVTVAQPPTILVQPVGQMTVAGGQASFSVAVEGTRPLSFRWRQNGTTRQTVIGEATVSFLTVTNVQADSTINVVVSNIVAGSGLLSRTVSLQVVPDTDGDGIPDAYETAHGLDPLNPLDATLDADGDGLNNLAEYRAGTDPRSASSYLKVAASRTAAGVNLEFQGAAGQTYTVEYTDDLGLGSWQRLADVTAGPEQGTRSVVDPSPARGRFYRLVTPRSP